MQFKKDNRIQLDTTKEAQLRLYVKRPAFFKCSGPS